MRNRQGTPVWYELMTDDPDPAQKFHGRVMSWTFDKPYGGVHEDYLTFTRVDGERVGGVLHPPDGDSFGPTRLFYVGVEDVDSAAEHVKSLGSRANTVVD